MSEPSQINCDDLVWTIVNSFLLNFPVHLKKTPGRHKQKNFSVMRSLLLKREEHRSSEALFTGLVIDISRSEGW